MWQICLLYYIITNPSCQQPRAAYTFIIRLILFSFHPILALSNLTFIRGGGGGDTFHTYGRHTVSRKNLYYMCFICLVCGDVHALCVCVRLSQYRSGKSYTFVQKLMRYVYIVSLHVVAKHTMKKYDTTCYIMLFCCVVWIR